MKAWPFAVKEQHGKPVVEVEYKGSNKTFVSLPIGLNGVKALTDWQMTDTRRD
jgi:hypothetical protein